MQTPESLNEQYPLSLTQGISVCRFSQLTDHVVNHRTAKILQHPVNAWTSVSLWSQLSSTETP